MSEKIIAYKLLDKNFKCHDFRFEVGKTYEIKDYAGQGGKFFTAFRRPGVGFLEVYDPLEIRIVEVEMSGDTGETDDDVIKSTRITVRAELNVPDLISRAADYSCDQAKKTGKQVRTDNKDWAAASGLFGAAFATTPGAGASATGIFGAALALGNYGHAAVTGYRSVALAKGDAGVAVSTDFYAAASAEGKEGIAVSTAMRGTASASGRRGTALASGAKGKAFSFEFCGTAVASSAYGEACATGEYGVAASTGEEGKAMGKEGCALFLVERELDFTKRNKGRILHVWSGIVGQEGIEADVWYKLKDGKAVKIEDAGICAIPDLPL